MNPFFARALLCALFSLASPASAQTAMQTYVEAMQPGTNWGNTRDAILDRYSWGAPETDQPMMDSLKSTIVSLNDPNLIATMHYYGWFPFSVNLGNEPTFDETSIEWVHTPFDAMYDTFVADGIPVVISEFSVLSGSWIQRGEQLKYHEYVQAYGRSKGMTMMLWDTGGVYGRNINDWANPDLGEIMMQAVVGRAITAESDLLFVDAGKPVEDTVVDLHLF